MVCQLFPKDLLLNVVIRFHVLVTILFWIIKSWSTLSSLSMQNAFLHGICEEVTGFDFNAIFSLAALLWYWRVFHKFVGCHVVFLCVSYLLGWPEVLLVSAKLCVAIFDKCTFARVEDCTLIIWTIICNVSL